MTQRQISHPEPIPACPKGHPARLIHDQRRTAAGGGYFVECRCCATRKATTADTAAQEWRRLHRPCRSAVNRKSVTVVQPDIFGSGHQRTLVNAGSAAA